MADFTRSCRQLRRRHTAFALSWLGIVLVQFSWLPPLQGADPSAPSPADRLVQLAVSAELEGAGEQSYLTAIAPAVLATRAIVDGTHPRLGIVPISEIVEPAALLAFLAAAGIDVAG